MHYFDHEKLHVYQAAIEFVLITETIIKQFPKGRAYLIEKSATSSFINITQYSGGFWRILEVSKVPSQSQSG